MSPRDEVFGPVGVLSDDLLGWLRDLPCMRGLHTLKVIAALLRKHHELNWDDRLLELASRLGRAAESEDRDRIVGGMQEVLALFDGHPSLREAVLQPESGHKIKSSDVAAVNARLGALKTQLFLSARQTMARIEWSRRTRA